MWRMLLQIFWGEELATDRDRWRYKLTDVKRGKKESHLHFDGCQVSIDYTYFGLNIRQSLSWKRLSIHYTYVFHPEKAIS